MSQNMSNRRSKLGDDEIRKIDPIDHVRLRPGMYFGYLSNGLFSIANEIFTALISQMRQKICTTLKVELLESDTLRIWHDGVPLSIAEYETTGHSILEAVLTRIGIEKTPAFRDHNLFSTFGMGWAVVNAGCRALHIQVKSEQGVWEQHYQKGRRCTDLTLNAETLAEPWTTCVTCTIDYEVFEEPIFEGPTERIQTHLMNLAYLIPGLHVMFENHLTGDQLTFCTPSGLSAYLDYENRYNRPFHPPMKFQMAFAGDASAQPFEIDAVIQFLNEPDALLRGFVNTLKCDDASSHLAGCVRALRDTLVGHSPIITRGDLPNLLRYVTLVVSLWHPAPSFRGALSRELMNEDITPRLYEEFSLALTQYFVQYPYLLRNLENIASHNEMTLRRPPR